MDRYKIARKKKSPTGLIPPEVITVDSFGFNNLEHELNDRDDLNRRRPFQCAPGTTVGRVGLIAEDLSKRIFVANRAHYFNGAYVKCESGECCLIDRASTRIACCLIIYDEENLADSRIVPWVFGRSTLNKLKELNIMYRVDQNDFLLKKPSSRDVFNPWEIKPIYPSKSSWQRDTTSNETSIHQVKEALLLRTSYLTAILPEYLGRPMTSDDLAIGRQAAESKPYSRRSVQSPISDIFF